MSLKNNFAEGVRGEAQRESSVIRMLLELAEMGDGKDLRRELEMKFKLLHSSR